MSMFLNDSQIFIYSILSFWLAFSATVCSEVVASVKKVKPLNDHGVLSHFPVPILLLQLSQMQR